MDGFEFDWTDPIDRLFLEAQVGATWTPLKEQTRAVKMAFHVVAFELLHLRESVARSRPHADAANIAVLDHVDAVSAQTIADVFRLGLQRGFLGPKETPEDYREKWRQALLEDARRQLPDRPTT